MKCVMIIDQNLPLGLIANTAAVLAVSLGHKINTLVGVDTVDLDGSLHPGITQFPISLLRGDSTLISSLREKIIGLQSPDVYWVDFCDVAQRSKHYHDYQAQLSQTPTQGLNYLGLALYGPKAIINSFTGNMGLLR